MIVTFDYGFRTVWTWTSKPKGKKERISLVKCDKCQELRTIPRRKANRGIGVKYCRLCTASESERHPCNTRRKTHQEYLDLEKLHNVKLISKPGKRSDFPSTWKCNTCDYEWISTFASIKRGKTCKRCAGTITKTDDDYIALALSRGLKFVGPIPKNTKHNTYWLCSCGALIYKRYDSIKGHPFCRDCSIKHLPFYIKDRKEAKIRFKLRGFFTQQVCRTLKGKGGKKTSDILCYTTKDLRKHLESLWEPWMNWDNYGKPKRPNQKTWSIDHIKPIVKFLEEGVTDPKLINALKNLQPMDYIENLRKGGRYYL